MSDEEQQPGLEALLECKKQVHITIRNEITEVLRKKKIIELSFYNEVNDPQSHELPDTKAKVVYQRSQNCCCFVKVLFEYLLFTFCIFKSHIYNSLSCSVIDSFVCILTLYN